MKFRIATKITVLCVITLFLTAGMESLSDFHPDFGTHSDCPLCKYSINGVTYSPDLDACVSIDREIPFTPVPSVEDPAFYERVDYHFSLRAPPFSF
jgi:hypothetical protein